MEEEHSTAEAAAAGEAFLEAVAAGDVPRARHVEMVELLLASGADPHHRSSVDGMHALHVLAEQGQRDFCLEKPAGILLLQVLLEAGVDPNVPTSSSSEV
ncbi:ankyrin repeat-containing protein [Acanthamoeba castellanii str. Neff]|uniref:Ankyrin repeat-containing protein n=1 Tax=Acanthamoeba castellanii (strain ATCC 30010 / Neff) TaxID=1257118 RepID=L8GTR8_ACACF|nr:ankyrin repeat-containing protein [Acanthamoeba castellanii str. Neff]ELR16559.1 ankyrin repeat-containing protein [Acanthamoeba castellanii str. Neff]